MTKVISINKNHKPVDQEEMQMRLERIKSSLDKINALFKDLKEYAKNP